MPKVFLSHSSTDKGYVEVIAKRLGKENIIYDAFTFEEGNKNIDEILTGLDESDIFVFFISEKSLESKWVKTEVMNASKKFIDGSLKKLFPVIIDKNIKHNDPRIPEWIQEYNIRYVSRPSKAFQRIEQNLRIVSWQLFPRNEERDQLFIGRYDLIKEFNERLFNFDLPSPICVIASGFNSIGRRKFLLHSLKNANKIRNYYRPLYIHLHQITSIEDFILHLYDLGYTTSITRDDLSDFLTISIEEKIELVLILLREIYETPNKIFIIDNGSIVNKNGEIADWFFNIIEQLKTEISYSFIFLVARSKVFQKIIRHKDCFFSISVNGLERNERNSLFQALLDIEEIDIHKNDKKIISEIFTGFPQQIKYAVDYIRQEGSDKLLNNLNDLVEFNRDIVAKAIIDYEDKQNFMDLLVLLSNYDLISFKFLAKIYSNISIDITELTLELANKFIIEFIGTTKEFVKLNDGIRDYIKRSNIPLDKKIHNSILSLTKQSIKDYECIDNDISEYSISIQESLSNNLEIPFKYLFPSHFLLAMKEQYENQRNYKEVIRLADSVLQNANNIDSGILKEIRYWLCLSLARRRDTRFMTEVHKIKGIEFKFLMGFYYRYTRQFQKALEQFNSILTERPHFHLAKRELIQVYMYLEDFDSAFELSKECYESYKTNHFYIQSYFKCVIKKRKEVSGSDSILTSLLDQLHVLNSNKSKEMYYNAKAQYEAYVLNKTEDALSTIEEGINIFTNNIYPYLTKLEILRKICDVELLDNLINEMIEKFDESELNQRLNFQISKIVLATLKEDYEQSHKLLQVLKKKYSPSVINKIEEEINDIRL